MWWLYLGNRKGLKMMKGVFWLGRLVVPLIKLRDSGGWVARLWVVVWTCWHLASFHACKWRLGYIQMFLSVQWGNTPVKTLSIENTSFNIPQLVSTMSRNTALSMDYFLSWLWVWLWAMTCCLSPAFKNRLLLNAASLGKEELRGGNIFPLNLYCFCSITKSKTHVSHHKSRTICTYMI